MWNIMFNIKIVFSTIVFLFRGKQYIVRKISETSLSVRTANTMSDPVSMCMLSC